MRNLLMIVAAIGVATSVAVAGACGVMAGFGGPMSAQGADLSIVSPVGPQDNVSPANVPSLNGAGLLLAQEEEATPATEGEEPEEETLGPGVDRQWDIVMSA